MKKIEDIIKDLPENLVVFNSIKEESKELIAREEIQKVWQSSNELIGLQKKGGETFKDFKKSTEENFSKELKSLEVKRAEAAKSQKETDKKVKALAEAQKKTEFTIRNLAVEFKEEKKQLKGTTDTISYPLENESTKKLPALLMERCNLKAKGILKRVFLDNVEGKAFGETEKNGKEYFVISACKSQLSKKDIDKIYKKFKKFEDPLWKTISPNNCIYCFIKRYEKKGNKKGINIFYSFEL